MLGQWTASLDNPPTQVDGIVLVPPSSDPALPIIGIPLSPGDLAHLLAPRVQICLRTFGIVATIIVVESKNVVSSSAPPPTPHSPSTARPSSLTTNTN